MDTLEPEVEMKGRDIVCLATQEWDAHWTPVQQVMFRLAPQNRVLYVEPFHPPFAWLRGKNELLRRQRRVERLREIRPNLLVYRPRFPYLPWNMRSRLSSRWNGMLFAEELQRLLARISMPRPWLWAFFAQCPTILELDFERVIYDCADELAAFFREPRERRFVARVDEILCRRADLVFVGSQPLYERKLPLNPKTFVVNHAADVVHFEKACASETDIPQDLARVPRPRLGFVGMMDAVRFDADLILKLADNPLYQIVLVGGFLDGADQKVPHRPNIHRLGMKQVGELPGYLKGMDALLMPYRLNEATRNIYPLKLHEYLAARKPAVSTRIPAVESFSDLIYVADTPGDFDRLVAQALSESDPALEERRGQCARRHSWEAHVEKKCRLIEQHLLQGGVAAA